MPSRGRMHDRAILDALEQLQPEPFDADVWRVARKGRDPLAGSSANGRWGAPGELEVLTASEARDGALAEVGFRLSLEPVWPSRTFSSLMECWCRALDFGAIIWWCLWIG